VIAILAALRSEQLGQPEALTVAYAVTVRALVAVIGTLNEQASALEQQMRDDFGRHPDAEIILSHIKPVLVQAAWAAIRVRGRLQARYCRLVRRFGGDRS